MRPHIVTILKIIGQPSKNSMNDVSERYKINTLNRNMVQGYIPKFYLKESQTPQLRQQIGRNSTHIASVLGRKRSKSNGEILCSLNGVIKR